MPLDLPQCSFLGTPESGHAPLNALHPGPILLPTGCTSHTFAPSGGSHLFPNQATCAPQCQCMPQAPPFHAITIQALLSHRIALVPTRSEHGGIYLLPVPMYNPSGVNWTNGSFDGPPLAVPANLQDSTPGKTSACTSCRKRKIACKASPLGGATCKYVILL